MQDRSVVIRQNYAMKLGGFQSFRWNKRWKTCSHIGGLTIELYRLVFSDLKCRRFGFLHPHFVPKILIICEKVNCYRFRSESQRDEKTATFMNRQEDRNPVPGP